VKLQKKVLAIHDISCVGRCSLTVVIPILSALGLETSILPTALLSTHTGGFNNYSFLDLTDEMCSIMHHWASLSLCFDALYSGFIGSSKQILFIEDVFKRYRSHQSIVLVDPAMADHGCLYATYTQDMVNGMKRLCKMADIITPNLTEAAFLLDVPYKERFDLSDIESMLVKLGALGPRQVVITGISNEDGLIGSAAYDKCNHQVTYAFFKSFNGIFYGAGDVFASALLSALIIGRSLKEANDIAGQYVYLAINNTLIENRDRRYGIMFETALPQLISLLLCQ